MTELWQREQSVRGEWGGGGGSSWQVPQAASSVRASVQIGVVLPWQYVLEHAVVAGSKVGLVGPSVAS
jgi:hypothetical protein